MKIKSFILLSILILPVCSCQKDEDFIPKKNILKIREVGIKKLVGKNRKIWKVDKAFLTNSKTISNLRGKLTANNTLENSKAAGNQSQIDISTNFNVTDDEFEFSSDNGNLTLIWRKGLEINTSAINAEDAVLDKYVSSELFRLEFDNESSNTLTNEDENLVLEFSQKQAVSLSIINLDQSELEFELIEKNAEDFMVPPVDGLMFSKVFSFEANCISGCAPGMIGSYRENSLYISSRENENPLNGVLPERVIQYSLKTDALKNKLFPQSDFVSKQLHIVEDKLYVMGASGVNIYDLNLSTNPRRILHGKKLSRFGMAVLDENLYLVGGDLNEQESNKVFKWNIDTETLSEFTTLPEPKSGARSTIVNDHLYLFGGSEKYYGSEVSDKILRINSKNPVEVEVFRMNKPWEFTFVDKFQNLIYVAGYNEERNGPYGIEFFIGAFDTNSNVFTSIKTDLPSFPLAAIHGMCIFNGKIFVLFSNAENLNKTWDVYSADLN